MKIIEAIKKNQSAFGLELSAEKISQLAVYYDLIREYKDELHLVAPCDAEEFAVRHILESLFVLQFLPEKTVFADVGTGAGLPSIPCLIVREDLMGKLIESKQKKEKFLSEAIFKCNLRERAILIIKQFQEVQNIEVSYVMCRALDKFGKRVEQLKKWSNNAEMLLFAGDSVRQELYKKKIRFDEFLIPMSEKRFIFKTKK
ncbi:MAG: 16S rRNA (guanine(527)-N(7))-methyltransferase RsmG [Aridibacter sp.]